MEAGTKSSDSQVQRYRRELRDLMVAALDFRRVPASPPPTRNPGLRSDCLLAAEHISDADLAGRVPAEAEARAVREEVADDILGCLERGDRDRLRPTEWAVRLRYRWWFELSWLGKLWHCLWGGRVPRSSGRPLREVGRS